MNTNLKHILTYQDLLAAGKNAELHYNIKTYEIVCRHTISDTGQLGSGTPPAPYTNDWIVI